MDCSICLESIESIESLESPILKTRCEHIFHKNCINKWIDSFHWRCPLCRGQLVDITLYKLRSFDAGDSKPPVMIYPIHFDGKLYVVKEKDYLEVRDKFNFSQFLLDQEEFITKVVKPIIFFSIMKTNNLEEAYHKAESQLNRT